MVTPTPPSKPAESAGQVTPAHYMPVSYLTPRRMASIGYQLKLLHQHFPGASVLEIGVGSGLFVQLARQQRFTVTTLDVNEGLNPDLLGSLTEIPAPDNSFDAFTCFQVLEHMPWAESQKGIRELARIARLGGVISVPTNMPSYHLTLYTLFRYRHIRIPWPRAPRGLRKKRKHFRTPKHHKWELEINLKTGAFRKFLKEAGFTIVEEVRPVENLYHHFFVVTFSNTDSTT